MVSELDGGMIYLIEDLIAQENTSYLSLARNFYIKNIPADAEIQYEAFLRSVSFYAFNDNYIVGVGKSDYVNDINDFIEKKPLKALTGQGKEGFYYLEYDSEGVPVFIFWMDEYFISINDGSYPLKDKSIDKEKVLQIGLKLVDGFYTW